jgi:hypothetical protein
MKSKLLIGCAALLVVAVAGVMAAAAPVSSASTKSSAKLRSLNFEVNLMPLVGGPCFYRAALVPGGRDLGCVEDADVAALARKHAKTTRSYEGVACVRAKVSFRVHRRSTGSSPDASIQAFRFIHIVRVISVRFAPYSFESPWRVCTTKH